MLILCLLLAGTVSGFSKGTNDLRYNPYLRSQTITPSYLERYKEGLRTLYSLERIIAGYRNTADNAGTSVYAKAVSAESRTEDPCYSEVFKYCAGQEIEIDIEAEAGYQNYKWFKDNVEIAGATGSTYTITAPGLYHFTAEDPQTCEGKLCCPYLVTQEPAFDAVIVKTDAACATGTSGSITVTPSVGQITDYTYSLDGAPFQASNIFTGLAGGTYKVTVKSAKGCSIEKTVEIAQPGGILAKAEAVCKDNKTTATILASGGVEPYTYSLDGGAFGAESVFADLAQGQHEVVVKDANGCTYKVTVDAFCECTPEIFEYCPGEVIEILAEAAPGQATYQWYKDGKPIDGATAATYTITSVGSYHYTSGGDDTCEGELCCPIIVREKDAPAVKLADAALSCTTTSAQLTATSDPANTFSWTGPDGFTGNTAVVTVNKPGEYIVTVTGVNGCITKDTATVTQDAQLPTITVNDGELNCEKKSVEIKATASAGVTYSWAGPGGFTATTETITATAAGDYIVTVTSVNGCIAKDTAVVTQNSDLPTVTVSLKEGELTCDTQTLDITATASAGATYSWAGPGGFTATTAGISVTEPGKYIVTVTSGNGCTAKDTSVITLVKTTPFLAATPSCVDNKGKVTLVASSGKAPYSYSKDGVTFQAEAVFTGLINGNYVFTVKDANGCIATVTAVVKCEIECVPQIYRFCENEAISVTIEAEEGLANYQWYRNGEAIAGATASVYEATEPGKYYYTAGTGDQCDGILCCPIEIFRYPGFIATAIPGKVDCAVGPVVPVTIHVNGGTAPFSYSMDGITFVSGNIFMVAPGSHKFYVKDNNGCINETNTVVIPEIEMPKTPIVTTNKNMVCGTELATLTGACAVGEVVQWNNGMVGGTIQVGEGTYTAVCTNKCGSSPASAPITIIGKPVPGAPIVGTDKTEVCGKELAKLTANCTVGQVIEWSNGKYGSPIEVGVGIYTARCKNECGYSEDSRPITITNGKVPGSPEVRTDKSMVCGDEKATLVAECPVGSVVVWSNGKVGNMIQVGEGIYTAICRNDCGDSESSGHITINKGMVPKPPTIYPSKVFVCGDETVKLTATCEIGSTVHWSNGKEGNEISVGEGIYRAVCKNTCGTSDESLPVVIGKDKAPEPPTIATNKTTVCGEEKTELGAHCASGGIILWSNGKAGSPIEVGAGTYTAKCSTACGISVASVPVTITTGGAPDKPVVTAVSTTVCGDEKVKLTAFCASGTVSWVGVTGFNPTVYVGTGIYAAKCTTSCGTSLASEPVVITPGTTPSKPIISATITSVCGNEKATLTGTCPKDGELVWSNGASGSPIQVGVGFYTARCVNDCGTSPASDMISIEPGQKPGRPTITAHQTSVCGDEKAMLTSTCTSGVLTWSNAMTGSPIYVGPGTYFATCVNACGASATSTSVTITTGQLPGKPVISTDKQMVCANEKAILSGICPAGGTLKWSNGMTGAQIEVGVGTYYANCVSECGTSVNSETIVINTQPGPGKPNIQANKHTVCGDEKVVLTGSCPSGGTLTWSNGATGSPISVGTGTYFATCVSSCGTSVASEPITIGTGSTPTAPTVVPSKTTLCGAETATLTATCATGTVLWSDGTTANPRTVGAGTYTATCVNACGSSPASTPVVITTQPAPGKPNIQTNKLMVCGAEKATLTGACPSGGILTWSNGATGSPISVGAGTYTATCVSSCGTSVASEPITIGTGSTPTAPTVAPNKTTLCGAETATLAATCATGTVLWSDGTTANPRTVGAGTYTATCVSACGSSPASTPVVITTQPAPGKPSIQANKLTVCGAEKATLTGSCPSGGILTWSNGSTGSPISVGAGTYTATCVSSCGTSVASEPITIGSGSTPAAPSVATNTNAICGTDKATLSAVCASGTIVWSNGATGSSIQVGAGTYTATCKTDCGTSPASTPIVITQGNKPGAPTITASVTVVCDNETATMTATCATGTVLWSDGSTANPRKAGAGTYTATCVNACGGSPNSNTIVVDRGPVPSKPNIQTNRTSLCAGEKATLTGACPTGGTLTWSNGAKGSPISVGTGTYTATCVNACGASEVSAPVVIGDGAKPNAPDVTTNKSVLCGTETATLTATGCAGGTINWSNGGTGTTKVVTAGTYTATCVTSCGTSAASAPVTINQESAPANFTIATSTATVCGTEKATLTATGCEGGTVTWSTGATGASIQVGAGSYSATCKTNCGGTVSAGPLVINKENAPAAPVLTSDKTAVCGSEKATLTATGCTGTVIWYRPGTSGPDMVASGVTVLKIAAGTYTATCTTTCGTSAASNPVTIGTSDKPAAPSVTADKPTVCEGEKATLTATGCAGTVTWSNGATGASIQVGAGTYTATCTTDCGTSQASLPVIIGTSVKPAAPSVSADKTTVCENEKATLTASGCAGTVTWSTGATGTSIQVGAGTYTATCTSGCGTSNASAPVTIGTSAKPAAPSVSADKATVCDNEKATLTATGCAGTITWSTGQTVSVIQVGAGTYTATCTTSCGTSAASVPVTIGTSDKPAAPSVSADKGTVCDGEKATLTATGCAGTVTWSTGQTVSVIQVGVGTYTATCTTSCGTSAASTPVTIGTSDKPAAPSVSADKAAVCEGEKATLTATGCAGTVTWSTGATGVSIQVGTGTYTATCTSSCGTSLASAPVTIGTSDKPAAPSVSTNKGTVCDSEKATLTASGCAGTVTWSTGATGTSIQVGAGTYTATCTSSCGTSNASAPVTIGTSDKPAAPSVTADKATVCDSEMATLTATGCAGTVTWSTGTTGMSIQVGAGTYTATCTTGCGTSETSSPVTIGTSEKPAKPMITASGNSVCGVEKVTLTASGCAGTVTWSTGATGTSIQVGAGTYTATCTTSCGSSDATAVSISEGGSPEPPVVTSDKGSICGSEKATLTATGCVGGVIRWSTGESGFKIQVGPGVYTATCTDACGNESIACIAVEIDNNATTPDTPAITASTDGVCGEELATLTATGCTGGTVIWSNGSQGHSIQVSMGTYTAICKTDCGESAASNSVTIQSKGGTLSISSNKTAYCAGETVTLTATGCTNGTIKWSNGATGSSITLPATASMTMTAVCSEGGGSVSTCDFAVGDVEFEYQTQQNPAGMNTRFLLTSNAYEILQVKTTPKFENVQEGTYKVISLVYIGDIQGLVAGANYSNLDKGSCYSDEETDISVCNPTNPGGNDCAAVGSIQVQVKTPAECGGNNGGEEDCKTAPTVTSSVGSATCVGTTVTLTALNCNAQVVWNTGATGASINFMPTATGAYKFSAKCVSSAAGCESEASQEITVNVVDALPKPTAIETLNNICPLAYVDLRNAILGAPTTGGTFEFHFENSPTSPLVTSAQVTNGVYYLFERNTAGCYSVGTPVTVVISENCENPVHPTAVDVAIKKTGDKETAEVNDQVTYTVKVSNIGGNGASDIKVRDIIPVGLQITEVSENAFLEGGVVRISLDTLAPGASVEVTYTGTVTAPGRIANKAELEAVAQNDTNQANNSSTWVINNVAQVDSLIGLAKAVGEITRREDLGANVYEVPFVFTITNMGLKDLDHVRLADTLSLTFGSADMVESIHLEADSGLTVNPNYTGSGEQTHLLIAEESAIAAGATLNVRLKVFVNMGNKASGSFANSATVYAGTVKEISDRSTDGVNPDPDGDGDPTNNSTDTEFNIGDNVPTYGIGAALAVVDSAFVNDKKAYEVTYRVLVRNYGADTLTGVFLTDTLSTTFAGAPEFTVTGKPVVTSQGSSLVINPAFDGKTDFRLLLPDAAAILAPAQTDTVEFKVTVVFGENVGPYSTNVIAFGEDNGTMLTDTSNAGVEIVKHLSTPTVFSIPEDLDPRSMVTIPEGFSPNGDGVNDNWKINLKGNAKIEKLIIVNRYGSTLYEEDGETVTTSGWDGKANKGMIPGTGTVPTGTYYYKLKLVGQDKYIIDYITVER
ncbi:MAG: gliding motility-associated C-terminal domain-containing protein [Leadbetterella sp.]|nr:gliding motility-associated C-terminal domain-containing protein [Leadbetterella sp.]